MDKNMPAPRPRFNTGATLRNWLHEIRLMMGALDAQVDRLERLEREIRFFLSTCSQPSAGDGGPILSAADPIAYNMEVDSRPDGYVVVALDGGPKFKLPPQLAEVFLFISSAEKERGSKDPLVGWRTRAEILEFVARSAGRTFHARYVNNLIHRLKEALRLAGYSRGLIQTHRCKGVRLAYKRGSHSLPELADG